MADEIPARKLHNSQSAARPEQPGAQDSDVFVPVSLHHDAIVHETYGPEDSPTLLVDVQRIARLDEHGVATDGAVLRLEIPLGVLELDDRDEVLQLQAVINRAVNTWRTARNDAAAAREGRASQ